MIYDIRRTYGRFISSIEIIDLLMFFPTDYRKTKHFVKGNGNGNGNQLGLYGYMLAPTPVPENF